MAQWEGAIAAHWGKVVNSHRLSQGASGRWKEGEDDVTRRRYVLFHNPLTFHCESIFS